MVHGHLGGRPPAVDLAHERRLGALLAAASTAGELTGSHDLSDGGLAQALVESALAGGQGASVSLREVHRDPFLALFSESAGRVLVTATERHAAAFAARAADAGVGVVRLGRTGGTTLRIDDVGELALDELRTAWEGTLPARFGGPAV